MLSAREALDTQDDTENQQRIRALGITINGFQKTLQGRAIIEREERFVLNGRMYQGFNQKALDCSEDLCSDEEMASCHDIDGTRQQVYATRKRRLDGAKAAKDGELAGRRRAKIAQERDELELAVLRRAEAKHQAGEPEMEPEAEPGPDPTTEPELHACMTCGKSFGSPRALNAHKMGSKH